MFVTIKILLYWQGFSRNLYAWKSIKNLRNVLVWQPASHPPPKRSKNIFRSKIELSLS